VLVGSCFLAIIGGVGYEIFKELDMPIINFIIKIILSIVNLLGG
jgi:hypothetical protein